MAAAQITREIVRAEIKQFASDLLCEAIGKAVGELMRESDAKIAALEAKINELEICHGRAKQWAATHCEITLDERTST